MYFIIILDIIKQKSSNLAAFIPKNVSKLPKKYLKNFWAKNNENWVKKNLKLRKWNWVKKNFLNKKY